MKAMVLAAGLGSRLGEMTASQPKCLVPVGGTAVLEHAIEALKRAGVQTVVINLHYLPDQVLSFVQERNNFGIQVEFSFEEELLDTGGGLLKAMQYFQGEDTFFVHNADIYSEIDLAQLAVEHRSSGALATLAVRTADHARRLLFTEEKLLAGWENRTAGTSKVVRSSDKLLPLGFCGISVLHSDVFEYMSGKGEKFSLITPLLEASGDEKPVFGCNVDQFHWADIGTPEQLDELNQYLKEKASGLSGV